MPASRLLRVPVEAGRRPEHTTPNLIGPPAFERRLLARDSDCRSPWQQDGAAADPRWWLLGVHGGAGVTSLLRAGVGGRDAERIWPAEGQVVIVARRSAYGLEWARDSARQYASGGVPGDVELAGLVVVADAPGRVPRRISRFLDLVSAASPRVWEVPWVEEWRLAGHAEPLPLPPAARQLNEDMRALVGASSSAVGE